jgi:hypothetical protein
MPHGTVAHDPAFSTSAYTTHADKRPLAVSRAGTHFHPDTVPEVARILDSCLASGAKIRLFLGDAATGVAWHEENDVVGRIGRSTGPCKVPLMVSGKDSGGPALLEHCIVGILAKGGRWLWKHPTLDLGRWTVEPIDHTARSGSRFAAACLVNGTLHSRHTSPTGAQRLVDFMLGQRLAA